MSPKSRTLFAAIASVAAAATAAASPAAAAAPQCDASVFANISGTRCLGLTAYGTNVATREECEQSCCANPLSCLLWNYLPPNYLPCWLGTDCSQNDSDPEWLGGLRAAVAPSVVVSAANRTHTINRRFMGCHTPTRASRTSRAASTRSSSTARRSRRRRAARRASGTT